MVPNTASTSITDPSTNTIVPVSLLYITIEIFHLYGEGQSLEFVGTEISREFRCFAGDPDIEWKTGLNPLKSLLCPPFSFIVEVVTKTMASHLGGHNGLAECRIRIVSAICDSTNSVKYNWANFFVYQLCKGAMDIIINDDPIMYAIYGKLRYVGCIS